MTRPPPAARSMAPPMPPLPPGSPDAPVRQVAVRRDLERAEYHRGHAAAARHREGGRRVEVGRARHGRHQLAARVVEVDVLVAFGWKRAVAEDAVLRVKRDVAAGREVRNQSSAARCRGSRTRRRASSAATFMAIRSGGSPTGAAFTHGAPSGSVVRPTICRIVAQHADVDVRGRLHDAVDEDARGDARPRGRSRRAARSPSPRRS